MHIEKPLVRPNEISVDEWGDVEKLRARRDEVQRKIRARGSNNPDRWATEVLIAESYALSRRVRELEPPVTTHSPTSNDPTTNFRPLAVHERAVRMAEHHVHTVSPLAGGGRGTTDLDLAVSALHRRKHELAAHPDAPREAE
ncbi:hypothetical protein K2P56_01885 [Patescibacteria group bacterium]|nr:hypothetical protein [Patescibacteria group bacterium]